MLVPVVVGLVEVFRPEFFMPVHEVRQFSFWYDPKVNPKPARNELGLVSFGIKSKGTFTANYPIEVEVTIQTGEHIEKYFDGTKAIDIVFPESYSYPIRPALNGITYVPGVVRISSSRRSGKGKIVFPYSGAFSHYTVDVDYEEVYNSKSITPHQPPIFVVEDFSDRFQMNNTNRSIGVALVSLAIAVMGVMLAL